MAYIARFLLLPLPAGIASALSLALLLCFHNTPITKYPFFLSPPLHQSTNTMVRKPNTRKSAKNAANAQPAAANAAAAAARQAAVARAPDNGRVVAPRPTVAGMRALQEALDVQRQEAEELREQMRQFIAANGNGNGDGGNGNGAGDGPNGGQGGQGGQGGPGGGPEGQEDQHEGDQRNGAIQMQGPGGSQEQGGQGGRPDNDLGAFRMEVDAKFNAIMDAINKGPEGQLSGTQGVNGNPIAGSNGIFGAYPQLPGMNATAPWGAPMGPGASALSGEYEVSTHYTGLAKKELQAIMAGNIDPAKIYLAIPNDSDLYPRPDLEEKARMEVDHKGQLTLLDNSRAQEAERNFKRLIGTLPDPLHFILAWSWFISLTNFHYKHAGLAAAMLRFGWKVISYARSNSWTTVMRGFVKVATPLLQGHLLFEMPKFDNISFIEALGPYQGLDDGIPVLKAISSAGAFALKSKGVTAPNKSATNPKTPDGEIICISYNNGTCRRVRCAYVHVCAVCFGQHQSSDCNAWNGNGYQQAGNQGTNNRNDYSGGNGQKAGNINNGGSYGGQQQNSGFANGYGNQGRWGARNA